MKPIYLCSPRKIVLLILMVWEASYSLKVVYAQTITATLTTEKVNAAAKSFKGFQAIAFPTQNASKIKVIIEDLIGNGAILVIRNIDGEIVHQMNCSNKGLYARIFNLSVLPDGEYSLEILALSKVGFVRQTYKHNFKIHSKIERTIKPWNKEVEKELFTPRYEQVR